MASTSRSALEAGVFCAAALWAWGGLAPPARADAVSEDRVSRLEEALKRQAQETERLRREYVRYDYERSALDPPDAIRGQSGLWLEAAYHFFPTFWCGCTSAFLKDASLFTLAARYQHMDLDDRVRGRTFLDDLDAWSVGLNLRVTERTVFRLDHTWFDPAHGDGETEFAACFSTYF